MIFYKRYPSDYLSKTSHLTLAQHGALTVMLDTVYATERPLPSDKDAVYRLLRAFDPAEREAVDSVLAQFWTERADGWINAKAERVMAEARNRSAMARQSAERRWERNATADAGAMRTHSEGTCELHASQSPESRSQDSRNQTRAFPPGRCRPASPNDARRGADGRSLARWTPEQDAELLSIPNGDSDALFAFSRRVGKAMQTCRIRRGKLRRKQ